VEEFAVDINLVDEDGETCLFVAESVEVAKCLVEELNINVEVENEDGMTAAQKFESEQEFPQIAAYLQAQTNPNSNGTSGNGAGPYAASCPPPLPPNVTININSASDATAEGLADEPDPEFRRRIEELAASENFNTEEGQQELRNLITDAIRGVGSDERDVRRRVG
jgi:hypothetical protein